MIRARALIATIVIAALAFAAVAQASYPKPPTGPWKIDGGSFVLKNGKDSKKGTVFLSKFQLTPGDEYGCEDLPKLTKVKVLGSFALKQFHRGGYTAWGIGKNEGGTPGYGPARVLAEGKTFKGGFYAVWNYDDPSQLIGGGVTIGDCRFEFSFGGPK